MDFFVDLRKADNDEHVGIISIEQYESLTAEQVANTIARLFVRCPHGSRVDLGTRAEVARAIGGTSDYSRSKVVAQ